MLGVNKVVWMLVFITNVVTSVEFGVLENEDFELFHDERAGREERQIPEDRLEGSGILTEGSGVVTEEEISGSGDFIAFPETDRVIQESISVTSEEEESGGCEDSLFGCCPYSQLPQHGPNGDGCCLSSEEGCCDDFLRSKGEEKDCDCENSQFGCCPDGVSSKWDKEEGGCGCKHTTYGCCQVTSNYLFYLGILEYLQDQYTTAQGPDYEGCPCGTSDYGCCSDGITEAKGANGEGCQGCEESEFGCCPDMFTPSVGIDLEGCECAASEYGCCPDGESEATGDDFEGCSDKPGEACQEPKDAGTGDKFSVEWFFDIKEGRCSRFWFGGEGGNKNRFPDHETCSKVCIDPPGSARCYLPK